MRERQTLFTLPLVGRVAAEGGAVGGAIAVHIRATPTRSPAFVLRTSARLAALPTRGRAKRVCRAHVPYH
jgi:hypothetical protein